MSHDSPTIPVPPSMRGKEAPPTSSRATKAQHCRWETHRSVEETFATLARLAGLSTAAHGETTLAEEIARRGRR